MQSDKDNKLYYVVMIADMVMIIVVNLLLYIDRLQTDDTDIGFIISCHVHHSPSSEPETFQQCRISD